MNTQLSPIAGAYFSAVNRHDPLALLDCFAEQAVVDDAGRTFQGLEAIKNWAASDIFAVNVTLEILSALEQPGQAEVKAKVDGDFDRTGLPDTVVIEHHLQWEGAKIVHMTCRLAAN